MPIIRRRPDPDEAPFVTVAEGTYDAATDSLEIAPEPVSDLELPALQLDTRHAQLDEMFDLLRRQHDVKYDVVAPVEALRYADARMWVEEPETPSTSSMIMLRPTKVFEDGIAAKLGIPRSYLSRMRDEEKIDLLDRNVNTWLEHQAGKAYLVRGFRNDIDGIGRAFLSDKYMPIDHLDALLATLEGVRATGLNVDVSSCNLSERTMAVNITAPEITAHAPKFLENYLPPFRGWEGHEADNTIIEAGLQIKNSEVGTGAYTLSPRFVIRRCTNGWVVTVDQIRKVHLGAKLDHGVVRWSEDTQHHYIEMIKGQTRDAVEAFLSEDYLQAQADRLEAAAGVPLTQPTKQIEKITSQLNFTETEAEQLLDYFIASNDITAGGVAQAVTAMAVKHPNVDRAVELEEMAYNVLDMALVVARS